ncbi:MAG TPA: TRAP transporter small permease subunit [Pseudolabrys sp.]|nr:TRAP transporter small permease subunit [Pseudolabrys sp.]
MGWLQRLDRLIGHAVAVAQWLALPLILLLFLQWPLRDIVRCCSREANDLGQIIFALFVAVSVTAATRAGTHLAADTLAHRYPARTRLWVKRIGTAVSVLPWAIFVGVSGAGYVIPSVRGLEAFPDTANPGYFIIKAALWVMALLIVAQAGIDILRPLPADDA